MRRGEGYVAEDKPRAEFYLVEWLGYDEPAWEPEKAEAPIVPLQQFGFSKPEVEFH